MSFKSLRVDELKSVAEFFLVEPEVADEEHGPTKKELLAALAAGDDPVSWEDYQDTYLKSDVVKAEERKAAAEEAAAALAAPAEDSDEDKRQAAEADPDVPVDEDTDEEPEVEDQILVRMVRKNGTYETHGLRFTAAHPFKSVPASVAESIISNENGFIQALPSEIQSYYN